MKHTKILQPGERIAEMWRSLNHTKSEGDLLGMTACCLFFRQKLGHVSWKVPGSEKKKFSIQSRLKLGTCHKNMMKVYMGHRCTQTYKKTFRANYYKPGAGRKTPCAANAWSLGDLFDLEKFHCVFTLSPATASNNCTYPQFATIGDRTEELVWLRTCVLILQSWVCFNAINKWARKSVRNLSWSAELFVAFASYSAVDYLFCLAFQFLDWYTFLGLKVFCVAIRDAVFCLVCLFFIPSNLVFSKRFLRSYWLSFQTPKWKLREWLRNSYWTIPVDTWLGCFLMCGSEWGFCRKETVKEKPCSFASGIQST